jgi:hypothetical protein
MFTNKVTTTKFWVSLPLFLVALLVTPSKGYCDDDVFGATPDGGLTFNDGSSTVGNDGLVEVKTNDPKCPKILWYPPLGHFICMPPDVAAGNGGTSSERNSTSKGSANAIPGRTSKR